MRRLQRGTTKWVAVIAAVVIGTWVVAAGVKLVSAGLDAVGGQHQLQTVRGSISSGARIDDDAMKRFALAHDSFQDAQSTVRSPLLLPARLVPLLGRQLRSFESLARAAGRVTDVIEAAAKDLPPLDAQQTGADQRLALAQRMAPIGGRLERELAHVDLGPRTWLLPPLAAQRRAFASDLSGLRRAAVVAARFGGFLEGPRRYIVLAANNGEMRAGSGMFLSAGALSVQHGRMSLEEMGPTVEMQVPPGRVRISGDLKARWGWLRPNEEWRNINATPRFDVSAPLAVRLWKALGRGDVDGVLAMDVVALRAVLRATGAVDVDGQAIGPDDAVRQILHDQYVGVPLTDQAKAARRERLGRLAQAALSRLDDGGWDPAQLMRELGKAAGGRHLMAWSADASDDQMWRGAGIAGALPRDALMISILNRGGTKLDQFLNVRAALELDGRRGTLRVKVRNETPAGEPPYIAGPHPLSHALPAEYEGLLAVTLPGTAFNARIDGLKRLAVGGPDGQTTVVAATVDLRMGAERTYVVRFELRGSQQLSMIPSARIPPVRWRFDDRSWSDGLPRVLRW